MQPSVLAVHLGYSDRRCLSEFSLDSEVNMYILKGREEDRNMVEGHESGTMKMLDR